MKYFKVYCSALYTDRAAEIFCRKNTADFLKKGNEFTEDERRDSFWIVIEGENWYSKSTIEDAATIKVLQEIYRFEYETSSGWKAEYIRKYKEDGIRILKIIAQEEEEAADKAFLDMIKGV